LGISDWGLRIAGGRGLQIKFPQRPAVRRGLWQSEIRNPKSGRPASTQLSLPLALAVEKGDWLRTTV
jgi:hypothetical protein